MAGHNDSLVRHAVLAGIVLSPEPPTRNALGAAMGTRFEDVFASWDRSHVYGHVHTLAQARLIVPVSSRRPWRYLPSTAGVDEWREWLTSPIDPRIPLRDALARLRSCRDHHYDTMVAIVELCERQLHLTLERDDPPTASLTAQLARSARRNRALADLRWCQDTRDEIAARSAGR